MEKEINLKKIYNVIKKRLWLIVLITTLVTTAIGLYSHYSNTLYYQSSTRMILWGDTELNKTLETMIREPIILEQVVEELGLTRSSAALRGQISVQQVSNSRIVVISVIDSNSSLAAKIANTTAEIYKRDIGKIVNFNNVNILSKAEENPYPINQNQNHRIIIGFVLGLIVSVGLVFILDSLDDTVKLERDLEQTLGLPVLGSISKMNKKNTATNKMKKNIIPVRGEDDWSLRKVNQQVSLEEEV